MKPKRLVPALPFLSPGLVLPALLVLSLTVLRPAPAVAQARTPTIWTSAWGGLFLDPGTVRDDESGTEWDFGSSFTVGASVQARLGRSLIAGIDVGYSPIRHEVLTLGAPEGSTPLADGRAHLLTTLLTGRLGAGGGGDFFTYLGGGIGAVIWGIPHLARWDPDFAFRVGPGLEYRYSRTLAAFVEWNRWWVLHQSQGVDDNTVRVSNLEIGARYGF